LAESLQKGATSLEHLDLSALEEFVLQAKTAGEGMRASVEGIQAAGTVISATLDVADKLRQSVDALPNLQEPLADVSNTLTGVSADIRNFGKALQAPDAAMEKLAKFLQDLVTNSDEYLGQTDDLSARAKQYLQTIGALQADMEAQAQKALDAQAAMNKALVDSAVLIRKELS
jgi:ABC-type transporter Mla subunit MlaD